MIVLDQYENGFAQIDAALSQYTDVDAIHFVTHADVSASTDGTGGLARSGNWDFEYVGGSGFEPADVGYNGLSAHPAIETQNVFGIHAQESYGGLLATFTVTNTNNAGAGSLRQAILDAKANAGVDSIIFNIALSDGNHVYYRDNGVAGTFSPPVSTTLADGSITDFDADYLPGTARSWYRITLTGTDLEVTEGVIIDGSTQFGYNAAKGPIIELNAAGVTAGDPNGLTLTTGASTVRGLVINHAGDDAIEIDVNASGSTIVGNYLGTDVSGLQTTFGNRYGITVKSDGNTIGGTSIADRNIIGGNSTQSNSYGIGFWSDADHNTVQGNYIGVGVDGNKAMGNREGITFQGTPHNNLIGGTSLAARNIIANHSANGINVIAGSDNAFLGNSIYSNGGQAIDLDNNGITANDTGDGDVGPNGLQNFPLVTTATSNSTGTNLVGSLNSNASTTYRIEFFGNRPAVADATNGEGERYLGFITLTTNGSGDATFNTTLANMWVNSGDKISATATVDLGSGSYGSTSEFAVNRTAASTGIIVVDTISNVADGTTTSITNLGNSRGADGRISLREAILAANNTANGGTPDKIVFAISSSMATNFAYTINVGSLLPTITQATIIDGTTQAGYVDAPIIVINGSGTVQDGLRLYSGSSGSTVRGLVIQNFTEDGIDIYLSNNNTIAGNYLGINQAGTAAAANAFGINIYDSSNNTIGGTTAANRNIISGNSDTAIYVGGTSTANQILGNYIGLNAARTTALANGGRGISVTSSTDTIIGDGTVAGRNVISGNASDGVYLSNSASSIVGGNYIGTDATGTLSRGNSGYGILASGSNSSTLGANVISGNTLGGLSLWGTSSAIVTSNYIGTNAAGTAQLGNLNDGIKIGNGSSNNTIGGDRTAGEGNVISGNIGASSDGIEIESSGTNNNKI